MQKGSRIGIVGCSNGQTKEYEEKIEYLLGTITNEIGLEPVISDYIYETVHISVEMPKIRQMH